MISKEGGDDVCIMKIEILGTESLGVRGLCCFVRTKNKKVLIITSHKETTKLQLNHHTTIFNKPIFDESTELCIIFKE